MGRRNRLLTAEATGVTQPPSVLPRRYDAFLYFDETEALHPLHFRWRREREVPETYPTGV